MCYRARLGALHIRYAELYFETHPTTSLIVHVSALTITTMGRYLQFLALLAFVCSAVLAEVEKTLDVFAWPLSAAKSQSFAKITYSYPSLNATVTSYSPLTSADLGDLVRLGFYRSAEDWSGILASPQSFGSGSEKKLRLLVDSEGDAFHLGFSATSTTPVANGKKSKVADDKDQLLVEVVRQTPGPQPHLNKPVVLNPDGKLQDDKTEEKSFFQK